MRKALAVLLLCAVSLVAQQPPYTRVGGVFVASQYNQWRVRVSQGNAQTGTATLILDQSTVVLPDGRILMPFNVNAPLLVDPGPNQETVTPTAVSGCTSGPIGGTCQISGVFTKTHGPGTIIVSGSFGLQEAINDANVFGGQVLCDSSFQGTTATITSAASFSNVNITDARSGAIVYYTKSGSGYLLSGGGGTGVSATTYGVKADGKVVCDAVTTNTSTTVTSATGLFTAADIGKIVFGTSSGCGTSTSGTLIVPQGTITAVASATSITVSVAANATGTGRTLVWGTDDTTAHQTAFTAVTANPNACGTALLLPVGYSLVQKGLWNSVPANCNVESAGPVIKGVAAGAIAGGTYIVPTPNFDFATCAPTCFGVGQMTFKDFIIWGAGNPAAGQGSGSKNIMTGNFMSVGIASWASASNATLTDFNIATVGGWMINSYSDVAGNYGCQATAQAAIIQSYCIGSGTANALLIPLNATVTSYASFYQGVTQGTCNIEVTGTLYSYGDYSTMTCGSGTMYIDGMQESPIANNAFGALYLRSGGKAFLRNSTLINNGSGPVIHTVDSTNIYVDQGGNTLTAGGAGTILDGTGVVRSTVWQGLLEGACTGVATASQTIGFYGLGEWTATTCTVTGAPLLGIVMSRAGTLSNLSVTAGTGGVNASSGVVTVRKNGSATALTCTLGTGTSCRDTTDQIAYAVGDIITAQFTTQAVETLADLKLSVWAR